MVRAKKRLVKRSDARVTTSGTQALVSRAATEPAAQVAAFMKPAPDELRDAQVKAKASRGKRPNGVTALSADERRAMIEQAAYFRAERRGFAPGHELQDWIAAEVEVDQLLAASGPPRAGSAFEPVVGVADDT